MSNAVDVYLLALAVATPLPTVEDEEIQVLRHAPSRPQTRSQGSTLPSCMRVDLPLRPSPPSSAVKKPQSKKRKLNFTIFVDTNTATDIPRPPSTPKRSKTGTPRTPLSDRTHSTNSTPAPSPRLPDTPFPFSDADPYWENAENYGPVASMTPPATPRGPSLPPTPCIGPPPASSARALRPRTNQASSPANLLPPVNMLLYHMLGLETWRVSVDGIMSAYRRTAMAIHPDKATPKEKELAHLAMQQLNATKELLLSARRRRQYHRDGVVPWVI
ncbi:hypothetical protein DDE82_008234 [Stemphylium lycopersici]|nr:hypothetical protein DDE82_008234 [Stemphylium lycopersici]